MSTISSSSNSFQLRNQNQQQKQQQQGKTTLQTQTIQKAGTTASKICIVWRGYQFNVCRGVMEQHSKWIRNMPANETRAVIPVLDLRLAPRYLTFGSVGKVMDFSKWESDIVSIIQILLAFCHGQKSAFVNMLQLQQSVQDSEWMLTIMEALQMDKESMVHKVFTAPLLHESQHDEFFISNVYRFHTFGFTSEVANVLMKKLQTETNDELKCKRMAPMLSDRKARVVKSAFETKKIPYDVMCEIVRLNSQRQAKAFHSVVKH